MRSPLQAALVEAIAPYCEAPRRRRGPPRRRASGGAPPAAPPVLPALSPQAWRQIGRDVLALHEGYTQRSGPFAHEGNPIHARLVAYQLYYLPRNWYRVYRVLQELPWEAPAGAFPPAAWLDSSAGPPTLRLLDLGCGTGAFSLAWLAWLAETRAPPGAPLELHLTLVDQGHTLLGLAEANIRAFARRALPGVALRLETHADGVGAFLTGGAAGAPYGVLGAAMTLNELSLLGPRRVSERAIALADALQARARPGACLLFVEPGTRRGFMNLMALREHLLHLPVLYPCPHALPCPMWGGAVRHWCHATERLPAAFFFDAALKRHAGLAFDMRDLQLSALAVQAMPAAAAASPFVPRHGERIVSAPLKPRDAPDAQLPAARERVVLACAPDGKLHERPAPSGGPYTRGRWAPAARPAP
jgi:SAM-dependent methyltransferase